MQGKINTQIKHIDYLNKDNIIKHEGGQCKVIVSGEVVFDTMEQAEAFDINLIKYINNYKVVGSEDK